MLIRIQQGGEPLGDEAADDDADLGEEIVGEVLLRMRAFFIALGEKK